MRLRRGLLLRPVRLQPGQPPENPSPLPASLFLKVGRPPQGLQRENTTVVSGSTAPGAIVSAAGRTSHADALGRFTITVPLREGRNVLTVEVASVSMVSSMSSTSPGPSSRGGPAPARAST